MPDKVAAGRGWSAKQTGPTPIGPSHQRWLGSGSTMRAVGAALTSGTIAGHDDFWGIGPTGTGGAGSPAPVLTQAQFDEAMDALYTPQGLKLNRLRTCDPVTDRIASGSSEYDIEDVNDDADPYSMNSSGFVFTGARAADMVPWIRAARDRGLDTWWWSPSFRENWLGPGDTWGHGNSNPTVVATDVQEYAEWMLMTLDYYRDQGVKPDEISTGNEPSYANGANRMSKAYVREIIKEVGPRLEAMDLLMPFVLGDDNTLVYTAAMIDTVMAEPLAARYVGAFGSHLYDVPLSNAAGLKTRSDTYRVPLFMTEFSKDPINTISDRATYGITNDDIGWAGLFHELVATYDFSVVDYMMGFFGQQEGSNTLIQATYSGGAYTGLVYNKVARYHGQFTKFLKRNDIRVDVASSGGGKVSAWWRPDGTRVIVAVNVTASPITTTISSLDLAGVSSVVPTRTSATENWLTLSSVGVSSNAFTVTLPATSVMTFVGKA